MRISGASPGLPGDITFNAGGVTSLTRPQMRMAIDFKDLFKIAGLPVTGSTALEMIVDGRNVYVDPPAIKGLKIPGGKRWVALDLIPLAQAMGIPTDGFSGFGQIDAGSQLRAIKQAKGIRNVGSEELDGVQVTHYKGKLNLRDLLGGLPAAKRAAAEQTLKALYAAGGGSDATTVAFEAWIGADGVMRRMREASTVTTAGKSGSFEVDERFTDFGTPLDVSAPAADDRWDATATLTDVLKQGLAAAKQQSGA